MIRLEKEYSTLETAGMLGVSQRALDNMVFRGKISYIKRGGKRRFRESDIQAFLDDCEERPAFGRREK